jgi:protein-disulfide isomerase
MKRCLVKASRFVCLLAVLVFGALGLAQAAEPAKGGAIPAVDLKVLDGLDRALGSDKAPVTIFEYASLTCSHCADFQKTIFPQIKAAYIDSGKLRWVLRDYPLDGVALKAAVIARCVEPNYFYSLIDLLFENQKQWVMDRDPQVAAMRYARLSGLSDDKLKSCNQGDQVTNQILAKRQSAEAVYKVQSTPSFVLNDQLIVGARDFATLKAAIDQALDKAGVPASKPAEKAAAKPAGDDAPKK